MLASERTARTLPAARVDRVERVGPVDTTLEPTLNLRPIGYICTRKQVKFDAPHQPAEAGAEQNVLELLPGCGHELALRDLAGFSRIWLLWWFHRNTSWRPLVLPPRGPAQRRGVFATRSPHRPNPLGLTPVQLLEVKGRRLLLGPCDLVDGTPVFDVKPYIAAYDAFPDARGGWTAEVEALLRTPPAFEVRFSALAEIQAAWLQTGWSIDFRPRLIELLARDPSPHRGRRIRRRGDAQFVIGCGAWRAVFTVRDQTVEILTLEPAYPVRFLNDPALEDVPDREAQLDYLKHWPEQTISGG